MTKIKVLAMKSSIGTLYNIHVGRRLATYSDFGQPEYGKQFVAFQRKKEALHYAGVLRKRLRKVL